MLCKLRCLFNNIDSTEHFNNTVWAVYVINHKSNTETWISRLLSNFLNSFIETNRSEWSNLTQINKLECRLHSEKRFLLFSILSMRQSRYLLTKCTCSWYQLIQWGLLRLWSSNIPTTQGSIFWKFYFWCLLRITTRPGQIDLARWPLK